MMVTINYDRYIRAQLNWAQKLLLMSQSCRPAQPNRAQHIAQSAHSAFRRASDLAGLRARMQASAPAHPDQ